MHRVRQHNYVDNNRCHALRQSHPFTVQCISIYFISNNGNNDTNTNANFNNAHAAQASEDVNRRDEDK